MPVQTTMDIANQLVELCKADKNIQAIQTLYADDAVSFEAEPMPDGSACVKGKQAIIAKNEWWLANHDVHEETIYGPYPHGDRFAVAICMEASPKETGQRMKMEEVALYTVENGKIVKEEFFYNSPTSE